MEDPIFSGIIVGFAGGASAGVVIWIIQRINLYEIEFRDKNKIYKWLDKVTSNSVMDQWRTTRSISSYTDLSEERVRYLCSIHKKIAPSIREADVWGIKSRVREGV